MKIPAVVSLLLLFLSLFSQNSGKTLKAVRVDEKTIRVDGKLNEKEWKLAPLADLYVGEAFAAAHRSAPSLCGFPEVLPTAGGRLFINELSAMSKVKDNPEHPCVFVLGGAKISDAFAMMNEVLSQGSADFVLTSGLTGEVMLLAAGKRLGKESEQHIRDRGLQQQKTAHLSHIDR